MKVTAWNNGAHRKTGAGYGLKININDRDEFFKKSWEYIILKLDDCEVQVNTNKSSFWDNKCRELINKEIGKWLLKNRLAPWVKGTPPKITLKLIKNNRFRLVI